MPSGHPIMAIRLFHKVYPPGTPNGHAAVSQGIYLYMILDGAVIVNLPMDFAGKNAQTGVYYIQNR